MAYVTTELTVDPEVDDTITLHLAVLRAEGSTIHSVTETVGERPEWAPLADPRHLTIKAGSWGYTVSGPRGLRADEDAVHEAIEAGVPEHVARGAA